mgnify:CR=1 FL=1
MKELELPPGWYLARDNKSVWWNLFVYITSNPPFKCLRIENRQVLDKEISPEEIKDISEKKISLDEFKVIQELQNIKLDR